MTGPDRLWLNLNHADQQRPAASFVTKGPLAGPPYTQYVRADVVEQLAEALRTIATHRRLCHEHDADCGHELRTFDAEDVRLMEWQARTALAEWEKANDSA